MKRTAANICKMATTSEDFVAIAQDTIVHTILKKQKELEQIKPENKVLSMWASKFSAVVKKLQIVKEKIYGERNETDMQKLGAKNANELSSKLLGSGKIYDG